MIGGDPREPLRNIPSSFQNSDKVSYANASAVEICARLYLVLTPPDL